MAKVINEGSALDKLLRIKALKEAKEIPSFVVVAGEGEEAVELEIKALSVEKVLEIWQGASDEDKMIDVYRSLCYEAIPELHDKELLEEYGCTLNPEGIVDKFFAYGDIATIGKQIKGAVDGVIDIKN